jgi:hypothetical protein
LQIGYLNLVFGDEGNVSAHEALVIQFSRYPKEEEKRYGT